ncbi:MAG: NAD(+) diphosphatase [Lachnospiraceae bacterium]|nr:NAD(+) diphosphatase [Lachnospiraceae bacterium]MEE1015649.1 NAD(+) diphosphatase [Lachnospiraceae bacterium]
MLQELTYGRLENEFYDIEPKDSDFAICVNNNRLLVKRCEHGEVHFPTVSDAKLWAEEQEWNFWREEKFQYVFRMQEVNYFLWMGDAGEPSDAAYEYDEIRQLSFLETKDVCFAACTAKHLHGWYRSNRFCGFCQTPTVHDTKERMVKCPKCGNLIFPKISPAVIIAVTDGDRLLLSKYAGRAFTRYALIAGYTEIGETIEETVHREVMEEVGLKVKNLRYYKSQPWGRDGAVLMGFFCDLDGSDEIHLDENELALAGWHDRHSLPAHDDGISLTREMIRVFEEGREPK